MYPCLDPAGVLIGLWSKGGFVASARFFVGFSSAHVEASNRDVFLRTKCRVTYSHLRCPLVGLFRQ